MVSLDSEQLEQLKAIGTFLGEVREEEGRTLEDIATKTYIPLRLLKAIEAGQEQILPEPVFVQGFIRRYGDALGLDGSELSKRFPVNAAPVISAFTAHQESKTSLPDPEPGAAAYVPSATNVWQPAELPSSRPPYLLISGIALAALAGLVFGVIVPRLKPSPSIAKAPVSQPQTRKSAAPVVAPVPSPAASADTEKASVTPSPTPSVTAIASPTNADSPVSIDVNLTERAWVQVVVDGAVEYEGILEKGSKQSWSGKESIVISSGNAGGVLVAFNKGAAKTMGKLGEIEEKTYTAKGLQ